MQPLSRYLYQNFCATARANKNALLRLLPTPNGTRPFRMLDCGCGDACFTSEIVNTLTGTCAYGIETQAQLADAAHSRRIPIVQSDLNYRLPFASAAFDFVHANQVIEHLTQTDFFAREVWRVLKPGGHLLLSTNNLASWHNIVSLILGKQPPPAHISAEIVLGNSLAPLYRQAHSAPAASHLRVFAYDALREFLAYHGFVEQRYLTVGFYPLPPRLAEIFCALDRRHGVYLIYEGIKPLG